MKILHINTYDAGGGAAIAAMRLHKAMLSQGIDSTFFCLHRTINDDERILSVDKWTKLEARTVGIMQQLLFSKVMLSPKKGLFSNMKIGYRLKKLVDINGYDIIYIHWINGGFLSAKGLEQICESGKKIYWFMHDMFPITGGCHYSFECERYTESCGNCPYLKNQCRQDFSSKQLRLKLDVFDRFKNISFIAPSKWLYDCARKSSVGKKHSVYRIPNLLGSDAFRPLDKKTCRSILNIPVEKKVILFGADSALTNPYKGFDYLVKALEKVKVNSRIARDDVLLIIFGSSYNKDIAESLPFQTLFMGFLHDEISLSLLYNSADVFCIPSLAENFPNTILEALHCCTPVVGFNVGGIPDMISKKTGYLVKYKDANDFAHGIEHCLNFVSYDNSEQASLFNTKSIVDEHKQLWED